MIRLHAVHHHFGEHHVLKGLDLTLSERRIAVVGGNGSGKSTFARLLNGLLVPDQGQVLVDGLDTRKDARAIRRKVGFVFQNPDHQIVLPTVEEDIAFGLKNLRLPPADISARVTTILGRYGLEGFRHHPAHLLSGGQKQLLALSSVLVMEPHYVVFDEPTTLLDLRNKRRLTQAIHDMPQTAIVVSHDLDLLRDFDRVLVFDEGRVVLDDVPSVALDSYVRMMA
ncbi:energy-coupling factor ABC transporter ATP-binding protein [Vitiosangium sp. GDMCC 1.1324]|uniref:energy-coupling factor ABC transporter ATP-binding protein n=1 Tax=Vitiosangium sp. (strain GDMCC 1.1324) TaxID=2138576 RepID=UPI000D39F862|nr:ATP-binding cassette domain-containing protein [Vitiosangium sp. GDMCC 1.1324]PTL76662.1 cobalt ABC transporter ATP-binding protein [Vitiosangium sp. GDMCC 1.1324]